MGITIAFLLLIAIPVILLWNSKASTQNKIIYSILIVAVAFGILVLLFIAGFERGRDPKLERELAPTETQSPADSLHR